MVETEPPKEHRGLLIPTKLIRPNRFNPRTKKDKESDTELFESVKKRGVETEIHVRPLDTPDEEGHLYEVFDGSRRLAAAKKAKIAKIRALIVQKTDNEAIEFGLRSIIRRNLNGVEMGRAIERLLTEYSVNYPHQRDLARDLDMSFSRLNQLLKLAKDLDPEVQEYIAPADPKTKKIPAGSIDDRLGTEIAKIPDKERQREVAKEIVSHPDLKWHEARLLVSEAREEPETSAPELARRRLEHHEPRRPTFVMSATDYEDIKAGKKRVLIEPTFRPGFHEDTIIDPLIKAESLEIADVFKRPLGRFKEMDAESAGYGTLEDFKQAGIEKHGGWTDEQVVYIYLFK